MIAISKNRKDFFVIKPLFSSGEWIVHNDPRATKSSKFDIFCISHKHGTSFGYCDSRQVAVCICRQLAEITSLDSVAVDIKKRRTVMSDSIAEKLWNLRHDLMCAGCLLPD
jgi:hypothetical protein